MKEEQQALLLEKKQGDFVVNTTPLYKPGKAEVLVKIYSAALNPVDWKIQKNGVFSDTFVRDKFPAALGTDIAGEVVELGEGVSQFAIGDKVFFQGVYSENEHAGFQQYTTADVHTLAKIPSNISYDEAATIPVAISVAYVGLYNKKPHGLGFDAPVNDAARGKYAGIPIVIIGGSGSVGQFAIQLARLSGFSPIITTSSLKHADFLKLLGATHVLDRNLPLNTDVIREVTDKPIDVVFDTISAADTQEASLDILVPRGHLAVALQPYPSVEERSLEEKKTVTWLLGLKTLPHTKELLREFWANASALVEAGDIKPNRFEVLPNGLNGILGGLRRLEENKVSGAKLVARPQEGDTTPWSY